MSSTFAAAKAVFEHRGQFPAADLLPIIPPGAKVASKSAVDPSQAGKIPGRFDFKTNKWWGLNGAWPTIGLTPRQQAESARFPTDNVGLRAEQWPAIDVDVSSEEARDLVEGIVNFRLGNAPARSRSNSPRVLFVFKRIGDEPIRKMRLVFQDKEGVEHAVEVLGLGQQFLIAGKHPSGAYYEWRENADLATWGANGLTKITASEVRAFMDDLVREVQNKGWTVVRDIRLRPTAGGAGHAVTELEPVVDVDLALAALNSIPNTETVLPMREDIVGVLAALKAAIGKEALSSRIHDAVVEWATKYDWADRDYAEAVWQSLTHVRVGPERLFGMAHKHGFAGDAAADFPDAVEAEAQIAVAQSEQDEQEKNLREVAKQLVYWAEAETWLVKDTGEQLSHHALNCYHGLGTRIAPAGMSGVKAAANMLINSGLVQRVHGLTYLPNQPLLVSWEFGDRPAMYLNKWVGYNVSLPEKVADKDVRPWLAHVEYLFAEQDDRDYLLDFLAHIVQHRGRKIRWAPIIIGNQGTGKDLFLRPLVNWLGKTNFRQLEPHELTGQFKDFYENELVVVEEIMRNERHDIYETMKATISGTASDTVTIHRKYKQPYEIPNICNFIFFSNHTDALNLSSDDRRFFVIMSHAEKRDNDYYAALGDGFYKNKDGWRAVIAWLKQRDISQFSPDARPRFNESKAQMIEDSLAPHIRKVRNILVSGVLKERTVLTSNDLLDVVHNDFSAVDGRTRDRFGWASQVKQAFEAAGFVYRDKQFKIDGHNTRVWCRSQEVADMENDAIRQLLKTERATKISHAA